MLIVAVLSEGQESSISGKDVEKAHELRKKDHNISIVIKSKEAVLNYYSLCFFFSPLSARVNLSAAYPATFATICSEFVQKKNNKVFTNNYLLIIFDLVFNL